MKIGILTFHRAHNYGAVLQCYALQEILKGRGHDVEVIDYHQPWIEDQYNLLSWNMFIRNAGSVSQLFKYLKGNLKKWLLAPAKARNFRNFRERFLHLSLPCTDVMPQGYDFYIVGSDQIWSLHCLGGQADVVYMGDFQRPSGSRLVGYAISADVRSVQQSSELLKSFVPGFDALSMREKEVAEAVAEITGSPCEVCLDPTLLTDASLWNPLLTRVETQKYVLMYEVRWNPQTKGLLRKKAEELAAEVGPHCKVIDLTPVNRSVEEFVSLFRNATYVVTTSFHGIVFSILFGTPFYALPLWGGYDLRYIELLESLGAKDRLVSFDTPLKPTPMDFQQIKEKLTERRKSSFDFIDKYICDATER